MKVAKFELRLFGINTYIVWDETTRKCAVIDPGITSADEFHAIDDFIIKNNLEVSDIINTHLHIDHAIGNAIVREKYNVPVSAHKDDMPLGKNIAAQAMQFGLPFRAEPIEISFYLNEGDVIKIGKGELKVLHVPGHSPGSVVLYDKEDGFVIAGDVLFNGSIGRTDLPGGSMPQLLKGIKEKLLTLPDDTVVYPGHGPATTIGDGRRHNPFLQ